MHWRIAARHPDSGRADQRQHARQQRKFHSARTRTARPPGLRSPPATRSMNCASAGSRIAFPIPAPAICSRPTGALYITVAGSTVGAAQAYPRTYPSENRYQIVDNYSWTKGAHSAKFGMDYPDHPGLDQPALQRHTAATATPICSHFAKDFTGNAHAGVKNYSTFTQTFGNPIQNMRTSDINFYFAGHLEGLQAVTFDYGVRYEKTWLPQPTITNPDYPATGASFPEQQELRAARQPVLFASTTAPWCAPATASSMPASTATCWIPSSWATAVPDRHLDQRPLGWRRRSSTAWLASATGFPPARSICNSPTQGLPQPLHRSRERSPSNTSSLATWR